MIERTIRTILNNWRYECTCISILHVSTYFVLIWNLLSSFLLLISSSIKLLRNYNCWQRSVTYTNLHVHVGLGLLCIYTFCLLCWTNTIAAKEHITTSTETSTSGSSTESPCSGWETWEPWSDCTKDCDHGLQKRYRTCCKLPCHGDGIDLRPCAESNCEGSSKIWRIG